LVREQEESCGGVVEVRVGGRDTLEDRWEWREIDCGRGARSNMRAGERERKEGDKIEGGGGRVRGRVWRIGGWVWRLHANRKEEGKGDKEGVGGSLAKKKWGWRGRLVTGWELAIRYSY